MRIGVKTVVYIDTNIIVYLLEGTDNFGQKVAAKLTAFQDAGRSLVTSSITITEFLAGTPDNAAFSSLETMPGLTFIDVTKNIALRAAELQRLHKLTIGDAIHLASCLEYRSKSLFTNDVKLSNIAKGYVEVLGLS